MSSRRRSDRPKQILGYLSYIAKSCDISLHENTVTSDAARRLGQGLETGLRQLEWLGLVACHVTDDMARHIVGGAVTSWTTRQGLYLGLGANHLSLCGQRRVRVMTAGCEGLSVGLYNCRLPPDSLTPLVDVLRDTHLEVLSLHENTVTSDAARHLGQGLETGLRQLEWLGHYCLQPASKCHQPNEDIEDYISTCSKTFIKHEFSTSLCHHNYSGNKGPPRHPTKTYSPS